MTQQTKKILNMIFVGDDGKLSFTALFAFFALIVMITLYIKGLIQGYEIAASWLDWSITIIEVAVLGRASQKVLMRGADAIATIKKPNEEKSIKSYKESNSIISDKTPIKVENKKPIVLNTPKSNSNFSIEEFNSNDGAPMPNDVKKNIITLMSQLEIIRAACGNRPITITSGYRSPEHNIRINGAKDSQHVKGKAADFKVKGMLPSQVAAIVKNLMETGAIIPGGLKAYSSWVHYDIRGTYTTWAA